jgi:hypothetical protein
MPLPPLLALTRTITMASSAPRAAATAAWAKAAVPCIAPSSA